MSYLDKHIITGPESGSQQVALPGQTRNNAGGFSWSLDDFGRLRRFLILGTEGGTYYASEREITLQNLSSLDKILAKGFTEGGKRAVDLIAEVSESGVAPKNDPALLALAYCARKGDDNTRAYALHNLGRVARVGTHLAHFVAFADKLGGWGRGLRRAVAKWYTTKSPEELAYQLVKYQARDGWANRDILRLSHARPPTAAHDALFKWAVGKHEPGAFTARLVDAFEEAKTASFDRVMELVREAGLPREAVPTQMLNEPAMWWALLDGGSRKDGTAMGMQALIRNLAKMTRVKALGVLGASGQAYAYTERVIKALRDETFVQRSKIHPIQVLSALKTYAQGHGERSDATWAPVRQIVDALDAAYYASFKNVRPAGKRTILGLDISGSMFSGTIAGVPGLDPATAAGAMAVVTMASEPMCEVYGFTTGPVRTGGYSPFSSRYSQHAVFEPLALSPRRRLDDNLTVMRQVSQRMGGTDCALPIEWAIQNKREVDTFVVYTDNETYAPHRHPSEALKDYRRKFNERAKLVVVGLTATNFTIADPSDAGSLDVVGFDSSAPALINDFARE